MKQEAPQTSSFGQLLKYWRGQRGHSQLALALLAGTTPRHLSFIETGRSRPGRAMVLRLSQCLDLPIRDQNSLLLSAGLNAEYAERPLDDEQTQPYRQAVERILERHDPYPGCAFDGLGRILMCNRAFSAFAPGMEDLTPEEIVDAFIGPGPMRGMIENWSEIAWNWVDRQQQIAARTRNPRLAMLVQRALGYLEGVERPVTPADAPDVISPRLRVGDRVIRTFATVMAFESAREITLSEMRVELMFPLDAEGDVFFRELVQEQ